MNEPRACKFCGCTEERACLHPDGTPCAWTEPGSDVCSACAEKFHFFEEHVLPRLQRIIGMPDLVVNTIREAYFAGWDEALRQVVVAAANGELRDPAEFAEPIEDEPPQILLPGRDF